MNIGFVVGSKDPPMENTIEYLLLRYQSKTTPLEADMTFSEVYIPLILDLNENS